MWYNFPLLAWSRQPHGAPALNKAGRVLSVHPRTNSTWHQDTAISAQLWTGPLVLILLLPMMLLLDGCCHPGVLTSTPHFLFLLLLTFTMLPVPETCLVPSVSSNFPPFLSYQTLPLAELSKADLIANHVCTPWVALLLSHESWPSEFHFHFLGGKPCLVCVPHSPI